jgi:hypothetical protein
MKYPLAELLQIRGRRQDAAAREVARGRSALAAAQRELERRQRDREEWAARRARDEEALWRAIIRPGVTLGDVDDLKAGIGSLKIRELEYERAVRRAEEAVAAAQEALDAALAGYRKAAADLERLREHKEVWQEQVNREAEAALEKELEEIPARGRDGS